MFCIYVKLNISKTDTTIWLIRPMFCIYVKLNISKTSNHTDTINIDSNECH
nr:MAG TPA_asm: hypothetical protein [Caudoviricetes sp.]